MRAVLLAVFAVLCLGRLSARDLGFGIDAFNRVVPATAGENAAFSPLSFEIDSVLFAEAVDPIRRSKFASILHVMDEFEAEFRPLARMPFETPGTNGIDLVWAHALVVDEPRRVDPAFRSTVQDLYGVEVCRAAYFPGIEAWVRTRFAGAFDGWRLPPLPKGDVYSLQDLVSVSFRVAPTNGWKRALATHTVYRLPLDGGCDFYALAPKPGRPLSSIRKRMTSVTLPEILAMRNAIVDPPEPVRLKLPRTDFVATNELTGAFSYFRLPTAALKPFPPGMHPDTLRQTIRVRFGGEETLPDAEPLAAPFIFFIHDPFVNAIPAIGLVL